MLVRFFIPVPWCIIVPSIIAFKDWKSMYSMSTQHSESHQEIKKLYSLLERVRSASLGSDYKTRMEMKEMADKIVEKIKTLSEHDDCDKLDAKQLQKDSQ